MVLQPKIILGLENISENWRGRRILPGYVMVFADEFWFLKDLG
jgi:hypothetical protein